MKSQKQQKSIIKNTYNCKVCNKEFKRSTSQLGAGTCSKECGYKLRIIKPNSGNFKKGQLPWNAGKKLPEEMKEKLSIARMNSKYRTGELHPRYKYGSRSYYKNIATKIANEKFKHKRCFKCLTENNIHIHHKDRDWKNNNIENLIYLCQSCHLKLHHLEDRKECICKICGKLFISGRRISMFCSQSCRHKDFRQRKLKNTSLNTTI